MRNKLRYLLFAGVAIAMAALTSCSETDNEEEEFPNWQPDNEAYFERTFLQAKSLEATDPHYKVLRAFGLEENVATHSYDHVAVKAINIGSGSGVPFYTDSVKVNIRGRMLPSTGYPEGYVFVQSYPGEYDKDLITPSVLGVSVSSSVTKGLSTAFQAMHIGDRWLVTVPHQLGYGTSGSESPSVQPYSTLVYDVELLAYYRSDISPSSVAAPDGKPAGRQTRGVWIYE